MMKIDEKAANQLADILEESVEDTVKILEQMYLSGLTQPPPSNLMDAFKEVVSLEAFGFFLLKEIIEDFTKDEILDENGYFTHSGLFAYSEDIRIKFVEQMIANRNS